MTSAEKKAAQRLRAASEGRCRICASRDPLRLPTPPNVTCGHCIARHGRGWATPGVTPHTCAHRGGLHYPPDPNCLRCVEIETHARDMALITEKDSLGA